MLTVLILVVFAVGGVALAVLIVVVVAIRQEPRDMELSNVAPSRVAIRVRRLLGVYLRRPALPADSLDGHEENPPDAWPTAAWTNTTPLPPGQRR
jgi:hypothetical protein